MGTSGLTTEVAHTTLQVVTTPHWEEEEEVTWSPTLMGEEGRVAVLPCHTNTEEVVWSRHGEYLQSTSTGSLVIPDVNFFLHMDSYTCTIPRTGQQMNTFLYPFQAEAEETEEESYIL